VVNRDVPPYTLAVGVPARVVKTFGPPAIEESPAGGATESDH
jgi:acetyltransferase-like isoleucine patch superfamily enzyme